MELDRARRFDVADDLALDDDRAAADLGGHLRPVADHQHVVRRDLAGEVPVDADLALERELALELGTSSEQGVELAASWHRRLPLLHWPRLRFLISVPRPLRAVLRPGAVCLLGCPRTRLVIPSLKRGAEH